MNPAADRITHLALAPRPARSLALAPAAASLAGLVLLTAGLHSLQREVTRIRVLTPLQRSGGWQTAVVDRGVLGVAAEAGDAARKVGDPAALLAGASVLAHLLEATTDARVIMDLQQRTAALALAALERAPGLAEAHLLAGAALSAQGDRQQDARPYLEQAAALDPHSSGLRRRLALVFLAQGDEARAVVEMQAAIAASTREADLLYASLEELGAPLTPDQITPATPSGQFVLGRWLERRGRLNAGQRAYAEALRLALAEPAGTRPDPFMFYTRLQDSHFQNGRFADAGAQARQAMESGRFQTPNQVATMAFHVGYAFYRQGHMNEALPYLDTAGQLQPDEIIYADLRGNALAAAGRHTEAAGAWAAALLLPRRDNNEARRREVAIRLKRARSLQRAGLRDEAQDEIRRTLMRDPQNPEARQLAQEMAYE